MAINISDVEPRVQYTATSGQTSFTVPFEFFVNADLKVYNGTTLLSFAASPADATEYSVTGAGVTGGGSITLGSPGATLNDIITISRDIAIARTTDFPTSGAFQIASLNEELDKIVAMCGQLERDLKFSPRAAATTSNTFDITFPNLAANKVLSVNSSGNGLEFSQDITDITTIAGISSDVTTVSGIASNVTAVAGAVTNINTVASNITNINTVATNIADIITVANDLNEAVSEIETVASDLQEASPEIDAVAGSITNVNTVGNNISNVNTVAGISANVTTVAGISSNVTTVAGITSNIASVASNEANITTVAGSISNVNSVGGSIANVNTVASNISGVNSFAERYRIASSAPTSSNDVGDLYFDSTANELKVYKSSGWAAAGSTVNGTAQRYNYTATANQTTFTGADTAGNTLAYDSGYADVYLNGVRLSAADITITSGTSVVLAAGAAAGDILDVVAYGTFNVASISASNIDSGTINDARLPTTMAGKTLNTAIVNANTLVARGDGSSADGKITLNCSQNSHGVSISSPSHGSAQSYNLILPTSVGTSGQVLATAGSNTNQLSWIDATETKPTVANVSQTIAPATATTISITGTNFVSIPQVDFINGSTGAVTRANTVSFTNATTLSVNCTLASGNYYVRIENPDGNAGRSTNNIITASTAPTFTTNAGSLGTFAGNFSGNLVTIAGTSDSAVTFSEVGSNLTTANVTLSSAGVLATTDFGGSSTSATQYNFTIRITDAEGQTADRSFSLTSSFGATGGGQFN